MGLITKEVEIRIDRKNLDWYKNKNYDCNLKDIIKITIDDLHPWSVKRIEIQCDYCGEYFTRRYFKHVSRKQEEVIPKDCCNNINCRKIKQHETLIYFNGDYFNCKVSNFFRPVINKWKSDSLIFYDKKCVITNKENNLQIHHLYKSYTKLLFETLNILNYPKYDDLNSYTEDQINKIKIKLFELHYKYGLGIPIYKSLHILFHKLYGKNPDQNDFNEFIIRYKYGEFNYII